MEGLEALIEEDRFRTNEDRHRNRDALWPLLEAAFARREAQDWVPDLLEAGVPVGEVNTLADSLSDEQVLDRQMVLDLESDDGLRARVAGNPIKFDGEREAPHHYPPALGEHSRAVLQTLLGLTDADYEEFLKKGIVCEAGNSGSQK